MNSGRFFVTNVLILGTAAILACTAKTEKRSTQLSEGNQQIQAAAQLQTELDTHYKILLNSDARFDWNKLSQVDRQIAKEKLAGYVSAVTRTFEIDAKKGLYITQKEVLQRQLGTAMSLQKSLEKFEHTYGENFDPKVKKSSPFAEAALPGKNSKSI